MKAVVAAFNQEKALVGAVSVIVKTGCETDGSFYSTTYHLITAPALDTIQLQGDESGAAWQLSATAMTNDHRRQMWAARNT